MNIRIRLIALSSLAALALASGCQSLPTPDIQQLRNDAGATGKAHEKNAANAAAQGR